MTESTHVVCPHCSAVNRIPADRPASEAKCGACKANLFTGEPIALTAKTFDKHVERNDMPLIVDFWAPWCGPCRTMAPIFDKAAKELEPRARFAKVNVDEEPAIAARFGIRGIPTLIAFEKGKVAKQHSGSWTSIFSEGWRKRTDRAPSRGARADVSRFSAFLRRRPRRRGSRDRLPRTLRSDWRAKARRRFRLQDRSSAPR